MNPGPLWLLLVGAALLGAGGVLCARQLVKRRGQAGRAARPAGGAGLALPAVLLVLGLVAIVVGMGQGRTGARTAPGSASGGALREVDFGFVELDHGGRAVAVASYKHGGSMMLRAGEVLNYQAIGDPPLPALELQLAGRTVLLQSPTGQLVIDGPAGQALPAVMRAQGDRISLPGGAPPRVSVKVQVTGPPREGTAASAR